MLPNERTTRSEVVALPSDMEALVAASGRDEARPLVSFLKGQRLNVVLVCDADSAFEEALLHRPNVVLIDDGLPPAGGIELCQRLKGNTRTHFLPAILYARSDSRQHRIRALAAGADAIFHADTDEQERRTRLWALLRSQAIYRKQERRSRAQGSLLRERGQWFGGFVHDLQNSIGALQANFEYLSQLAARPDPGAPAAARADLEECVRDSRLVFNQLARGFRTVLEFERFEAGRVTLKETPLRLETLVRDARDELELQATGLRKPVLVKIEGEATAVVGDADMLKQAVVNLAAYLLRQPRNTRVLMSTQTGAEGCRVVVAGDADNISAADRGTIFQPYSHVPRRAPLGQGLGLALARVIIELHGGQVRLEDLPDGASAFVVELKSPSGTPKLQMEE